MWHFFPIRTRFKSDLRNVKWFLKINSTWTNSYFLKVFLFKPMIYMYFWHEKEKLIIEIWGQDQFKKKILRRIWEFIGLLKLRVKKVRVLVYVRKKVAYYTYKMVRCHVRKACKQKLVAKYKHEFTMLACTDDIWLAFIGYDANLN